MMEDHTKRCGSHALGSVALLVIDIIQGKKTVSEASRPFDLSWQTCNFWRICAAN